MKPELQMFFLVTLVSVGIFSNLRTSTALPEALPSPPQTYGLVFRPPVLIPTLQNSFVYQKGLVDLERDLHMADVAASGDDYKQDYKFCTNDSSLQVSCSEFAMKPELQMFFLVTLVSVGIFSCLRTSTALPEALPSPPLAARNISDLRTRLQTFHNNIQTGEIIRAPIRSCGPGQRYAYGRCRQQW
ncbi:hypothetical protein J6590_036609 [Homalodisca vitripennis]|nr:hypothetical protein J6590_036609 [Homalodisca vitripennis]